MYAGMRYSGPKTGEASLLVSLHKKLIGFQKDARASFYWFLFEDKGTCETLADAFWRGEAKVDAKAYLDSIRTLKGRILAGR